ncbi:hypothetical protein BTJ40_10745 [Microbulbifer sp. A4B17]|uniref:helix-turn-helix domain-containing protein n=1 Tax=Microbulbifer sp. A4B17 TaxID=359370 RepID=UPI000D52D57C|nr:helix-turn-helix transcriptional regulator [Microbulbifer sp. A4B17]AWF81257.1 hypothetical protein BTJ40_10745 [Microbulbifer sp. A4B17]
MGVLNLYGQRIAGLRKELRMTQVRLAEYLGISQQHMQSFEAGRRKVSASMLPKLLRQVEQVALLPKAKQKFVSEMLETVIQQASH